MPKPVALVTGGARRIGATLALTAARAGCAVVIHCRHSRDEAEALARDIRAEGGRAAVITGDLGVAAERGALMEQAMAAFGRVDLLINNASHFEYDTLDTLSEAALRAHYEVNVAAPLRLISDFAKALPPDREGLIVNILDYKVVAPNPDFLSYTASRVCLAGLTGALALALAPRIRICGVAPGLTLSSTGWPEADLGAGEAAVPLKRRTALEDLSAALAFVMSARSLTGQNLVLDGGAGLLRRDRDLEFAQAPAAFTSPRG